MVIGVSGYGYSGASAYLDALKEFEGVQTLPLEFQFIQEPDGVLDLMQGIVTSKRRLSSNTAIKRFKKCILGYGCENLSKYLQGKFELISKRYIDDLVELSWDGRSYFDPEDVRVYIDRKKFSLLNRLIVKIIKTGKLHIAWPPDSTRFFSFVDEEVFIKRTQCYIQDILSVAGIDNKGIIVLDQLFSTTDPLSGSQFFVDTVHSFVVDRDPRDVYLLTNIIYPEKCSFMPNKGDVNKFISYYKLLHHNRLKDPRVHYLAFEDLIYHYNETIEQLEKIISIKHQKPRTFFMPENSINNTQMFKRIRGHEEEIIKIENELGNYLYDFENAEKGVTFKRNNVKPF